MPILNKIRINQLVDEIGLIRNPRRFQGGELSTETASYDLRAGTVLWRERGSSDLKIERFDEDKGQQPVVTLQSGQMVFVITHEELQLPGSICGTVYSRNKLQKENILALNAGHIDPGYDGPIIIRLINLGADGWPLQLGDEVFTVVFHTVEPVPDVQARDRRTKQETLTAAMRTATSAFSNPFHDLYKDEIKHQLDEHYSKAESNLRTALSKDFFRKDEVHTFVFIVAAAVVAGAFILARMPWDKVWCFVKYILNR